LLRSCAGGAVTLNFVFITCEKLHSPDDKGNPPLEQAIYFAALDGGQQLARKAVILRALHPACRADDFPLLP
jgi:hypothetical protein